MLCASECGREVVQATAGGRRKHCTTCRPPRARGRAVEASTPATLRARTVAELAAIGSAGTLDGALLVQLAERLDATVEGSPYAALTRAYRQTLDAVRVGAKGARAEPGDEIAKRRAAKLAAAGG